MIMCTIQRRNISSSHQESMVAVISTKKNVHFRLPSIYLLLTNYQTYQKLLNTRSQVVCYIYNKNVAMPLEILESCKSFGGDLGTRLYELHSFHLS